MKAKLKSLLQSDLLINSGMIFSASFFGALFMFVSNLVLSRVFGPADFGMYKTVLGLFMFVPALVDFGASATLTKYIAEFLAKKEERKNKRLYSHLLGLNRLKTHFHSRSRIGLLLRFGK